MNMENELKNLLELSSVLSEALNSSEESTETLHVNNIKLTINKEKGKMTLSIEQDEYSELKEKINSFKEVINELEDCLFVNAYEEMSNFIDVKEFDKLISKDNFTAEEAKQVEEWLAIAKEIFSTHIENEIEDLSNLLDRF